MAGPQTRRAEFMMVVAYAGDLATGQFRDFALQAAVVAMRLAHSAKLDEAEYRNVYHLALLRYAGCNADTHLLSQYFGDELELRRDAALNLGDPGERPGIFRRALTRVHAGLDPAQSASAIERDMAQAGAVARSILAGHCEVARRIGGRLGLSEEILGNLGQLYERWDGKGLPHGVAGNNVMLAVRVVTLAQDAVIHETASGREAMLEVIRRRRDGPYEAELADLLLANPEFHMDGSVQAGTPSAVLELEPLPHAAMDLRDCENAFLAIADMIDMRMPHTMGHSRAVARLAEAAARRMKLPEEDVRHVRWAAYVHDLGELAIPVERWLRGVAFAGRERDDMQLHPYHGERALAALSGEGQAAAGLILRHHERLNGSGYHRKVTASDLSPAARILAAAEAYQSAREARPHRPAASDSAAAEMLRKAMNEGRLCPDATSAVLESAGHTSRRTRPARLAGLTAREIEILRLLIKGMTAKDAAQALGIAPKTAENHIQNLYAKIGVTTRAGAALFAVENGLAS